MNKTLKIQNLVHEEVFPIKRNDVNAKPKINAYVNSAFFLWPKEL